MNILTMENISKSYSEKKLLDSVSFGIDDMDRIGVVGINGTGKSTLLKLISGIVEPDSGNISKGNSITVQVLSQAPEFYAEMTAIEQIFHGDNPIMKTIKEYEYITARLCEDPDNENLQNELMTCSANMDLLDAWNVETQICTILTKLGVLDISKKMGELSGGQKKRVAMAEALIQPSDLLILDEPTNHIDFETINWLEDFLKQRKGALILVTHDRYFLNRVVNRIVEIDKGSLYSYAGNFEYFLEMKILREEMQSSMEQKCRRLYASELSWIRRGARARTTKQKSRIERFEVLKDVIVNDVQEQLDVPVAYTRLGKKVIELEGVCKAYDGKSVINDFNLLISPTDRIGIIGPNGAGKTTLLNLIAGIDIPDSGTIDTGETVKIAYYRQNNEDMDYSMRVIDYIKQTAEYVESSNGYRISASQMLERFLFDSEQQYSLIKNLSGGERRRLLLAKVLLEKPNVLLLDEPTNDLDIQTLEVLEEYLDHFQGAVLVVSHDRYFLDKTTDKLLAINVNGGYDAYNDLEAYKLSLETVTAGDKPVQKKDKDNSKRRQDDSGKRKMTFSEKKEYEQIEDVIEGLENSLAEIGSQINNCGADYVLLQELTQKQENLQHELADKINRWAELSAIAEQA